MDYFISHLLIILSAACAVALAAILWWYLMERNAELKRARAKARSTKDDETEIKE